MRRKANSRSRLRSRSLSMRARTVSRLLIAQTPFQPSVRVASPYPAECRVGGPTPSADGQTIADMSFAETGAGLKPGLLALTPPRAPRKAAAHERDATPA